MLTSIFSTLGWASLTSLVSQWMEPTHYGLAFGILSTSSRFGDMGSKIILGRMASAGSNWRSLFYVAATLQAVMGLFNLFIIKSATSTLSSLPSFQGDDEPTGKKPHPLQKASVSQAIFLSLSSPRFWCIAAAVGALNMVMEFDKYLPLYLHRSLQLQTGTAAQAAAVFPCSQLLSLIWAGIYYDRLTPR